MTKKKKKDLITIKESTYYPDAEAKCSCGAKFKMGSTKKEIQVEICSKCHPFYTGTQKLIDTSGRVDKFKNRLAKQQEMLKKVNKKTAKNKKEQEKVEKIELNK